MTDRIHITIDPNFKSSKGWLPLMLKIPDHIKTRSELIATLNEIAYIINGDTK